MIVGVLAIAVRVQDDQWQGPAPSRCGLPPARQVIGAHLTERRRIVLQRSHPVGVITCPQAGDPGVMPG